jgi:hypothetical protein
MYGQGPVVVTSLTPPAGASAIATLAADSEGHTNLYVAGDGAISLFVPAQQSNTGSPVAIISNSLISGVDFLEVNVVGQQVTLWARNASGILFYSRCATDQQTTPSAWSAPIPIAENAEQVASLLNVQTQSRAVFVHSSGQSLIKLTQDPVTTQWWSQSLLLPTLDVNDVFECYTFTTQINVVDENNLPLANATLSATATSPVNLYVTCT